MKNLFLKTILILAVLVVASCSTEDVQEQTQKDQGTEQVNSAHSSKTGVVDFKSVALSDRENRKMKTLQRESMVIINRIATLMGRNLRQNFLPVGSFEITTNKNGSQNGTVTPLDDEITIGYECDPPGVSQMEPCGSTASSGIAFTSEQLIAMRTYKRQLSEKVDQMAKIMSGALNRNLLPVGKFKITANGDGTFGGTVTPLDDEITIGYYCDPPGVCQSKPCGS